MSRRKTHEEFVEEMKIANPNIEILGKYKSTHEHILCMCKLDGHKWYAMPSNLLRGKGCPVCSGKSVKIGVNNVGYLRPDLIKYFQNKEDANIYSVCSAKYINCICPVCKTIKRMSIQELTKYGFSCCKCSDKISYPNKFFRAFIEQTNAKNIQYEWQPTWAKPYKYDTYFEINNEKFIVEIDGGFHINNTTFSTAQEIRERDKIKDILASKNNINIIRISAYKSNGEYLSNQINQSKLSSLFDLSKIDWDICEINAEKNILIEVCKLYDKSPTKDIKTIAFEFRLNRNTIVQYLKAGSKIGLCDYTPEKSIERALERRKKSVLVYKNDIKIGEYDSLEACAKKLTKIYGINFIASPISVSIKKNRKYKGFTFKYAS